VLLLVRLAADGIYLTEVLPAVVVFGLGLAVTVAPLTATPLEAAPAEHAGVAPAVNNDVARVAGLIVVAVPPALAGITGDSYLNPVQLGTGFRTAVLVAAATCLAGGLLAAGTIRNPGVGAAGPLARQGTPLRPGWPRTARPWPNRQLDHGLLSPGPRRI
jgi:hypothetical protein